LSSTSPSQEYAAEPRGNWIGRLPSGKRLLDVFSYRSLILNLVVKDLKVRYKNSVLGFLWSLLNPLLMMVVFTFVFTRLLGSGIPNFQIFVLAGLLPWNWCAASVGGSINAIVGNSNLISKVYFPRELLPMSVVASNMANFILALPAMVALMVVFHAPFTWGLAFLPALIIIELVFLCGVAMFLSCLNVFYRDTGVIMEVLLTAWFFVTPIFYRMEDVVPSMKDWMYRINPMAAIVSDYHTILYYGSPPGWSFLLRTFLTAVGVFVVGYIVFARFSHRFGEEL
jgi:lipopolysaccharide transport system permease protein